MKIKHINQYIVKSAFTIFDMLFLPGDCIYISTSFREGGSTIDWRSCFDTERKHLGKMNDEYFWGLTKGCIEDKK